MKIDPNVIVSLFALVSTALAILLALRKIGISRNQAKVNTEYLSRIEQLDRIIRNDPTNALAVWHKGELYEAMGDAQLAIRFYRAAHTMCPKAYSTGDYTDAFTRVAKSRPDLGMRIPSMQRGSH